MSETRYFRKGLGNRDQVVGILKADYHSGLVQFLKSNGHVFRRGGTELRLAREFGFCYGVDRAVEFAYEARSRFPDRTIWITGEIIHNPGVNRRLLEMGIHFLPASGSGGDRLVEIGAEDVVLIPAFGMDHDEFLRLKDRGSILVDTTCGSVLTVWKSVERYAAAGITSIVHGKVQHEETRATCSQVRKHPGAHYLVVRDKEEAALVCRFIEGDAAHDPIGAEDLMSRFAEAHSEGFDPERDLSRVGLANQTTMLSSESLEIAGMLRDALRTRHGQGELKARFHSFDTICSATQERQDAVLELLQHNCDRIIVIGGFNSSNTTHLVEIASHSVRTYHVEDADNLISPIWIRHKPLENSSPIVEEGWLPPMDPPLVPPMDPPVPYSAANAASGDASAAGDARGDVSGAGAAPAPASPFVIGVTAGASTPDSEIGKSIARLLLFRGVPLELIEDLARRGNEIAEARKRMKDEPSSSKAEG